MARPSACDVYLLPIPVALEKLEPYCPKCVRPLTQAYLNREPMKPMKAQCGCGWTGFAVFFREQSQP